MGTIYVMGTLGMGYISYGNINGWGMGSTREGIGPTWDSQRETNKMRKNEQNNLGTTGRKQILTPTNLARRLWRNPHNSGTFRSIR